MILRSVNTDWAKTLIVALKNEAEVPTDGWLNSDQVAKELGVKRSQAIKHLQSMRSLGLIMEKQFKTIINPKYGIVRGQMFYKLTANANAEEKKQYKGVGCYEHKKAIASTKCRKKVV